MDRKIEFDFPGRLPAPHVDFFIHECSVRTFTVHSKKGASFIMELYEVMKNIKGEGQSEVKTLWIEAPRGSIEEFGDFEDLSENGCFDSYDEFFKTWKGLYPEPSKWYELSIGSDGEYAGISIGYRGCLRLAPPELDERLAEKEEYMNEFLEWLIAAAKKCVEMLKEGTYNKYVDANLDYGHRIGIISRSDYWKVFPESKEAFLGELGENDFSDFVALAEKEIPTTIPENRCSEITSGIYMECASSGLRAMYGEDESIPSKDVFRRHVFWSRDFFDVDENDPKAFEKWCEHGDFGGHSFEVVMGSSRTRISLYPHKDEKGCYFIMRNKSAITCCEATKFYLGIYRKGFPIVFPDANDVASRFLGTNYIGVIPSFYNNDYVMEILGKEVYDFICLEEGDEELLPYIRWSPLKPIELAEKG